MDEYIHVLDSWRRCNVAPHWPADEPETAVRCAESMEREILRLRRELAEAKAAPAANAGGEARQPWPMAFAVWGRGAVCGVSVSREDAGAMQREFAFDTEVMPLYAAPPEPRGWLTAEEREAVVHAIEGLREASGRRNNTDARTLVSLLARSTPPRVKMPPAARGETPLVRDLMWGQAIREAGGEVE